MRIAAWVVVGLVGLFAVAVVENEVAYRTWCRRVEGLGRELHASPSGFDGEDRNTSQDPHAYAASFSVPPTRFVIYEFKPMTALVFEPPPSVWTYQLMSRSVRAFNASNRVYGWLRCSPPEPYSFLFEQGKPLRVLHGSQAVVLRAAG
jgi:hypothetical protein